MLADKLANIIVTDQPTRRGPLSECEGVYGPGNLEDWEAVEALRLRTSWVIAQKYVDETLGITSSIRNDRFRYHWRRKCSCWPRDVRL